MYVDMFNYDGSDSRYLYPYQEMEEDAVVLDLDANWVGYELSEEEMTETITCPHCGKFPFKQEEIQTYEIVRIVMFKSEEEEKPNDWKARFLNTFLGGKSF